MIEITISLFFFIIINFFSGIFALKFIFGQKLEEFTFSEKGLVGIIFLIFTAFLFHFFLPLNEFVNLVIFILILSFSFRYQEIKKVFQYKFFFLIFSFCFTLTLLMTFKLKPHEDYGFYHLPYIINIISDKIIFGLSNIQPQYAWNSSWLNYSALFKFFFNPKTIFLSNSVLIFYIFFFFIEKIFFKKKISTISDFYVFFLACYIVIKFSRITEHGFDFPANIFLLLSFYFFIRFFEEPKRNTINSILVLLFSSICLTIKVSTFIGPIIFILTLYFYYFYFKYSINNILRLLIFVSALYFFWFVQQFIYSGCFFPYLKFTCIDSLSWSNNNITNIFYDLTGAFNKSFNQYNGKLTAEEYLKNYNWVSTWAMRNKIEFLEHLIAYCIPVVLFFITNKNKNFITNEKKNYPNVNVLNSCYILLLLNIFGFFMWFHKSPVIRFGIPYLFFLIFFVTIFPFILKKSLSNFFFYNFKLILILSFLFNFSKNFDRIINKEQKTYWPIFQEVKFSSFKNNDYRINIPSKAGSTCWAIPYICFINFNKNIEIKNNKGYLFVLKR